MLQTILMKCVSKEKSIDCIGKLIRDCPYPNAIPVLLDILRVYFSNPNDRTSAKGTLRIIRPFLLEMKNYHNDHEHLLQMYEIYACVLSLYRRMLLQAVAKQEIMENDTLGMPMEERDQIKEAFSIAKEFINKLKKELTKTGDDSFRLFLLQDALEQFVKEGEQYFEGGG